MPATRRAFSAPADFDAVSEFLFGLYEPDNLDGNWIQPIWEYAYTHPYFDDKSVERIGIWEDGGGIVAVVMYELTLGEAFFQVARGYEHLKPEMLRHAEEHLVGTTDEGARELDVFVSSLDAEFAGTVRSEGFERNPRGDRPTSRMWVPDPYPEVTVPDGFTLKSLADDNNLRKADRVLWRGFNHPGEPSEDGAESRKKMQSGPHYRLDTTMVVEAPNGDFVSFAGLWYDAVNGIAYVEPVATDPDYRRMGLARAAILEGVRRCRDLGADRAFVGSTLPVYLALGFEPVYTSECWRKVYAGSDR